MYDSGDEDVLVARITTQRHVTEADYRIVDWQRCGLLAESFIRLGKQATIQKHYITKQLGALEPEGIDGLKSILRKMFSL
jgi:mRNA interferase MazF